MLGTSILLLIVGPHRRCLRWQYILDIRRDIRPKTGHGARLNDPFRLANVQVCLEKPIS